MKKLINIMVLAGLLFSGCQYYRHAPELGKSIVELQGLRFRLCVLWNEGTCDRYLPKSQNYHFMVGSEGYAGVFDFDEINDWRDR